MMLVTFSPDGGQLSAAAGPAVAGADAKASEAGGHDLEHALQEGAVHGADEVGVGARELAKGAVVDDDLENLVSPGDLGEEPLVIGDAPHQLAVSYTHL